MVMRARGIDEMATIGPFDAEQKFWIEVRVNVANFNCDHPDVIRNDTQKIKIKAPSVRKRGSGYRGS